MYGLVLFLGVDVRLGIDVGGCGLGGRTGRREVVAGKQESKRVNERR